MMIQWNTIGLMVISLLAITVNGAVYECYHGEGQCDCEYGYTGPKCNIVIDFCNHTSIISQGDVKNISICGEHGTCLSTPDGAACSCDAGWDGPFCKVPIDQCHPVNPCENGATCVNVAGPSYACLCDQLHIGQNCSSPKDFCNHEEIFNEHGQKVTVKVCGEHGTCNNTEQGATCTCDHGYTGSFCQHEIEYNCTSGDSETHAHGSQWNERCNTCMCEYGIITCTKGYWCPQRCAIFSTAKIVAKNVTVGCKPYENCIPDTVACARENPSCDFPIGWCFPVGVVMLEQLSTPPSSH